MKQLYNGCNKCLVKSCCIQVCNDFITSVNNKHRINLNKVKISRQTSIEIVNRIINSERKSTFRYIQIKLIDIDSENLYSYQVTRELQKDYSLVVSFNNLKQFKYSYDIKKEG